ncbi:BspA family leucine-rich repeat surface protein, partial [uncultured Prevotella sp.]|uniref:BspA family leucine-rich repeat surface protein n=1 Tax=uncultured Prevotella sp. TaxID=159272 RepID=UPI0028040FA6
VNICQELPSLDLSKFNTAIVTDMSNMFCNCYKLSSLTLSESFNTAKVTDMSSMFRYCENLSSLALSKFNTAKVWNMSYMFRDCKKISSLDLSNFNTTKVKYMQFMFDNCQELSSLTLSESFNTAKVTDMSDMFRYCKKLSSLDLSNFNTANVTNMSSMFYGCSTLQTIYVSENFVVTGITDESLKVNLFTGCKALKGAIPEYNSAKTSSDYANYKTGYFTKLVVRNGNERYGITGETTQLTVDNLVLADNKDLVVFDPFTATAASYNRDIKTGTTWATLCLPFEVSLDEQNFRAFELGSVSNNEVVLKELNTTIPAGTPVFIKMNEGANSLSFSVADKKMEKDAQTAATTDGGYQLVGLYATKMFDKTDNNCYILKNGKLMNPAKILNGTSGTEAVGSKPFRAYMVDNSSSASGAKMFSISENGSNPTGIDQLTDTLNDSNAVYYDLQGHRLSQPQKGINILKVGNKTMKVIIK